METQRIRLEDLFRLFSAGVGECLWHAERPSRAFGLMGLLFGPPESAGCTEALRATPAWRIVEAAYRYGMEGVPSDFDPALERLGGLMPPSGEWNTVIGTCEARRRLDGGAELDVDEIALLAMAGRRTVLDAINDGKLAAREEGGCGYLVVSPESASDWLLRRGDFQPTRAGDVAMPLERV